MGKDAITIYWSQGEDEVNLPFNRQMLYLNPVNLYKSVLSRQNPALVGRPQRTEDSSFYVCPAVRGKMQRVYYLPNAVETRCQIRDFQLLAETGTGIPMTSLRTNSMVDTVHVRSDLTWFFFADEPVEVSFTSPYFHALDYLSVMQLPPATFDIGSWFRTFNVEYILQRRDADLVIHEGDPLAYMEFHTDKPIRFVRFEYTDEIGRLGTACSAAPRIFGKWKPLSERYAQFRKTQMRENILRIIEDNVIGESDV
jgi:hypothetical protein